MRGGDCRFGTGATGRGRADLRGTRRDAMYQEPMGKSRRKQFGAIPVRFTPEGQLEIMLITSRQTRRWIVPKGWPMKGLEGHDTAAREAFEEAGVNGSISDRPIGSYVYAKRLKRNSTVDCEVE